LRHANRQSVETRSQGSGNRRDAIRRAGTVMLPLLAVAACSSAQQAADEVEPSREIASTPDALECPGRDRQEGTCSARSAPCQVRVERRPSTNEARSSATVTIA
jgi:hypothetical protein